MIVRQTKNIPRLRSFRTESPSGRGPHLDADLRLRAQVEEHSMPRQGRDPRTRSGLGKTQKTQRAGRTRRFVARRFNRRKPEQPGRFLPQTDKLKIIPLGGMEGVGRNMMLFEYANEIIIVDMGLEFPDEDMPGIDFIIPNVNYLRGKEKNIKAVIITHGHFDHIGAIPYLMPKLGNPVLYTGRLTAGIIQKRQEEFKNSPKLNIIQIDENFTGPIGSRFKVEFFRVNHNIPDSFAVVIHTPLGKIVHTGDFKFDYQPVNDTPADLNRIALIGGKGVLALLSDSTNAEQPGHQISESVVEKEMDKIFSETHGRMIIGTFASLLSRAQQIIKLAEKHGRKVLIEGRSMKNNVEIAHKLGYLKVRPGTIIEEQEFRHLPDNKVIVICTGAQAERSAVLMRVANKDHRFLSIKPGDTIIFSSSVIPGNERAIQNLKDSFYRQGARVYHYKMMDIHAGGHAKQEDLKLMIKLVKPKYFVPIQANHYMLQIHADLAMSIGISRENILVADDGQVMEFFLTQSGQAAGRLSSQRVITDDVMVDGLGVGDVSHVVLRERRQMADEGMFVVIATINRRTGELIGNPDLISRGFVYMKENKELIEKTRMRVKKLLKDKDPRTPAQESYIKNKIRNDIGEFLFNQTKRRPMVLPVIIEV